MCFWQVLKVDGTSEQKVCHTSVMFAESVVIQCDLQSDKRVLYSAAI